MSEPTKDQPAAPAPGTPEHDAAMAAVADARMGTPAPTPSKAARPDHVPEKFWDAEKGQVRLDDVLKAHKELEAKLGAKPGDPPKPEEKPAVDPAVEAAKAKGVDFPALSAEYAKDGKLSDATYADLAAKGFDKAAVDTYIAGQQAIADKYDNMGFEAAGGKDAFARMAEWAGANVPPAELKAFNDAVVSMDEGRMKLAVAGMRSKFEAAVGRQPNLLNGTNTQVDNEPAFNSLAEQKAAQGDPRYKKDPAFRDAVIRRIAKSTFQAVQAVN